MDEAQTVDEFECFQGLVHHLLQSVRGRGCVSEWRDREGGGRVM